jgi:leader peptidase (prepilin peptidase)/N-methyltransferase
VFAATSSVALAVTSHPPARGVGLGLAGLAFVVAAVVDVVEHRIPNVLVATAMVCTLVAAFVSVEPWALAVVVCGASMAGGALLVVRLGRGLGMGDVKMGAVVGASCASTTLVAAPLAIAATAFTAATFGLVTRRRRIALGPFLWLGWAAALAATQLEVIP